MFLPHAHEPVTMHGLSAEGSLVTQPEVVSRSVRIRHDVRRKRFRYRDSLSCLSGCNGRGGPTKADKRGPQNKARLRGGTFDPVMPLSRGTTLAQEAMGMLVLVARASKHGATEEITERVAQALTLTGQVGQLAPQRAGPLSPCRSPVRRDDGCDRRPLAGLERWARPAGRSRGITPAPRGEEGW